LIEFLLDLFRSAGDEEAIIWGGRAWSYAWLYEHVLDWEKRLAATEIGQGTVTAIDGDFSPNAVALFLALMNRRTVLVPLTAAVRAKREEFLAIAEVEAVIDIDAVDNVRFQRTGTHATHEHIGTLRSRGSAGVILFSSGSTGQSKGMVHDFSGLLEKFRIRRKCQRMISFLLYDHWGGLNTLLHVLSNQGTLITVPARTPDAVLDAVSNHRAEVLPTTPTFLNLMLLSEAHQRHDLSSLKLVTYGTEPMPESTLRRLHVALPEVTLQQTYGLSEIGVLRSKSRDSGSLWVKLGGEGIETRVVDGILQIKTPSAMLGYLNAPSPVTDDGWFITGDLVDVDGEYFRIRGRRSDIINVGGAKVFPAEVESVLLGVPNIAEATVYGEKNAIMGHIVCAKVALTSPASAKEVRKSVRSYCAGKLEPFKIPVRIQIVDGSLHGERFKKLRAQA
jgi:acyl-coenzyme A synthetase/AMP-(fatty) acid ligase